MDKFIRHKGGHVIVSLKNKTPLRNGFHNNKT